MNLNKTLFASIILSLSLILTSCMTNKPKSNIENSVQKEAPKGEAVQAQPLSSEINDSSFIPTNLLDLNTQNLLETILNLGERPGGSEVNAKVGKLIKEYFEKSGLEPYKNGSYYNKYFARQLVPIEGTKNEFATIVSGYFENVIGKIKGKDSTKAIVISAHFDTVPTTKGALDNGTGVVSLLKLAKELSTELKGKEFPVDIIFAAFNTEENGLLGSTHFISTLREDYKDFYNLNIDCIGLKDSPLAYKNSHARSQELYDSIAKYLDKYAIPRGDADYFANGASSSDQEVFQKDNRAAITLGDDFKNERIHGPVDNTLNGIDIEEIDRILSALKEFIITDNGKIY